MRRSLTLCHPAISALTLAWAAGAAQAQTVTRIAPIPGGVPAVCFLDSQRGFVGGLQKQLHRTLDGGLSWTTTTLPGFWNDPIYSIKFLDANVGIITGNNQDVFRTTNGGASWAPAPGVAAGSWRHQMYVSPTTGFIGANGAIMRTTDGGATWEVRSGYPDCPSITGMDFLDADVGFASGGLPSFETGVFKTTDGGSTWTLKLATGAADVIFLTPTTLLAFSNDGVVRSDDAGESWFPTGASIATGLTDLERVDAASVIGVSGAGDIWRTTDGGFNWERVWTGEGDLPGIWTVRFRTPQMGTVAGVNGLIYASHDGGATWTRLNRGASFETNAVAALDNGTLVTVGHHGYAQTMIEGGTWGLFLLDPPSFGRDTAYSAVSALGSDFVYAAGHEGSLARSMDGGHTWEVLNGGVHGRLYANDVKFTDPQHGWLTGWDYPGPGQTRQETFTTQDGGVTWQVVANGNFPGVALDVVGSSVWIQAGNRTQWRSADGGLSFVAGAVPMNSGITPSVADLSFADGSTGYVCGWDGYLARTLDGGASWTQLGVMVVNTHYRGVLAHGNEVWVCGAKSGGGGAFIRRSTDQGLTWQTWNLDGKFTTPYRMVRTPHALYACGYGGELWRVGDLPTCHADCNTDGALTVADFGCFQTKFVAGDPYADCNTDGTLTVADFGCFQTSFVTGCP